MPVSVPSESEFEQSQTDQNERIAELEETVEDLVERVEALEEDAAEEPEEPEEPETPDVFLYSLFTSDVKPTTVSENDNMPVELGMRFTPSVAGEITAIDFYRGPKNTGPHTVHVWSATGTLLGTGTSVNEPATFEGWVSVDLDAAVPVEAGKQYTASYLSKGFYSTAPDVFPLTEGPLKATSSAYKYNATGGYPDKVFSNGSANYMVDVLLESPIDFEEGTVPEEPEEPEEPAEPEEPTQPAPVDPRTPAGVTLKALDGGPGYLQAKAPGWGTGASFWPVGVWFENVAEAWQVAKDKETGINTYFALVESDLRLDLVKAGGLYAFPFTGSQSRAGSESVGWTVDDEPDMQFGWWGAPTAAQIDRLDKLVATVPKDGRGRYINFGLGIQAADLDYAAAKTFVKKYADFISSDFYFYSALPEGEASRAIGKGDNRLNLDETHRAYNYAIVVERLRQMADYTRPVFGFVEIGHPGTEGYSIQPKEVGAAIWHSIIGGAQGVVFFNHSFGGPAQTQHALREAYYAPQRAEVIKATTLIRQIAPALNSPTASGLVTSTAGVATIAKWNDGKPIIVAGNKDNTGKTATFTVKGRTTGVVTVLGENRTITMTAGAFSDNFADGTATHVYQL